MFVCGFLLALYDGRKFVGGEGLSLELVEEPQSGATSGGSLRRAGSHLWSFALLEIKLQALLGRSVGA
jgi:hypothetical protein